MKKNENEKPATPNLAIEIVMSPKVVTLKPGQEIQITARAFLKDTNTPIAIYWNVKQDNPENNGGKNTVVKTEDIIPETKITDVTLRFIANPGWEGAQVAIIAQESSADEKARGPFGITLITIAQKK